MFDDIILTAEKEGISESGIILSSTSDIKPTQRVLSKGPHVPEWINIGDLVEINIESLRMKVIPAKHGIGPDVTVPILPLYKSDDGNFLKVTTRQLLWKLKEE